jgi:hypothetical protein
VNDLRHERGQNVGKTYRIRLAKARQRPPDPLL